VEALRVEALRVEALRVEALRVEALRVGALVEGSRPGVSEYTTYPELFTRKIKSHSLMEKMSPNAVLSKF
jgi:hypothetical protein